MIDILQFEAPLGVLGLLIERILLKSYMQKFLEYRNSQLKNLIEKTKGNPLTPSKPTAHHP